MHSAAHSFVVPALAGGEQAEAAPGAKPPEGGTTNGETANGEENFAKAMHSAAHSFAGQAGQAAVKEKPPKGGTTNGEANGAAARRATGDGALMEQLDAVRRYFIRDDDPNDNEMLGDVTTKLT